LSYKFTFYAGHGTCAKLVAIVMIIKRSLRSSSDFLRSDLIGLDR